MSATIEKVTRGLDANGQRYLDLLKVCLVNAIYGKKIEPGYRAPERFEGLEWPEVAHTMIGLARLTNFEHCIVRAVMDGVPGDVIETGVWRGGACILARACLETLGDHERVVWVADSFQGLPRSERNPEDPHHTFTELAVSLEEVAANFESYNLLDERVKFLPGWFKDTLHAAPIERLAVARLDGDIYESTMEALTSLYPKLSPGGFLIVDDYYVIQGCREAVEEYRAAHAIDEEVRRIDHCGCFWRRAAR